MPGRSAPCALLSVGVLLLAGCSGASTGPGTTPTGIATTGTALAMAQSLPVKGRAPLTGYTRAQFGDAWTDDTTDAYGHNGCDTRDDMLASQMTDVVKSGTCKVVSASIVDPYTGVSLKYVRGRSDVDIDHVVALGDAWQTGAQKLTKARRTQLANDPLNLLVVSASANRSKGDADAASWLPKQKSYRCAYVARQVAVKRRYQLWVTAAERDAIARVLSNCPAQAAPTGEARQVAGTAHGANAAAAPVASTAPTSSRTTPATPRSTPATSRTTPSRTTAAAPLSIPASATPTRSAVSTPAASVYYADCAAARAAGVAPILRGQPGYRAGLDRDDDGVACE